MRYTILTTLVLSSCVADALAQRRSRGRAQDLAHFTYETIEFDSPSLGGKGSLGIYPPKDYGAKLHGLRIYFDTGSRDRYRFGPSNVEFSKRLTQPDSEKTPPKKAGGDK